MVRIPRRLGAAILIAIVAATGTARAGSFITTVQTTAANTSDSYLVQDHVDEENGGKSELRLKASSSDKNRHIILTTSLPSLANRTVLQAWLGLTEFGASNATPIESRVYPLLEAFDEEKVSWKEKFDKVLWATPGGTRDPRWSGRALVSTATNGERVDWQVGPIVNEWLLGTLPPRGFILEPDYSGNDREVVFRSSDYTSVPASTPRLTLYVTDEPPAVRRAVAEFQPTAVRASTPNVAFTLWMDVEASGSTPSGAATGFDLIAIPHDGAIAGRSVDRVTVAGVDIPLGQVTWFENGTSMTLRVPRITTVGKVRIDFHADVLASAADGTIELPVYLDDFETPSVWQQAVWPGNADGTAGNGDTWVLAVSAQNLARIDLTPDTLTVVSRLCTMLSLVGEDLSGNRFGIDADSFRVVPQALGAMSRSGRFCGLQPGTGSIVAFYGAFRDTSRVTVTPALTPTISSITLRGRNGVATNTLAPRDTMFLDVALSDGDGFRDVSRLDVELYHAGHELTRDGPAFRAGFEWRRGNNPAFAITDPTGTSWTVIPALCAVDTVTNTTGSQTVRFALRIGSIARASSSGAWSARATAFSATPPDTTISLRTGIQARTYLAVSLSDTTAAFAAGRAGAADLPLRVPPDGEIGVKVDANTAFDLRAMVTDLVGVSSPGVVLRVGTPTRRVAWAFDSEGTTGGLLDTTYTSLPPTESAPVLEGGIAHELYLWIDHPPSIAAQDYRGSLRVQAAASGDTTQSIPAASSLTATVVSSGEAAQSATAEVLPHEVQVGIAAQSMTAYLSPTVQLGNTGIDRIQVHIPSGYGTPVVTSVRLGGFPTSFTDLSAAGTAEVRLSLPVITSSRIEVRFTVATPTALDADGANFVVLYDDVGTTFPPQVAKEGDANGIADGDTWKVIVSAGPVASVSIAPDSVAVYVGDSHPFTATVADAYGHPLTPTLTWTTIGGVGQVNAAGLFTAESMGAGRVIVAAGGLADTAQVTVRPTRGIQVLAVTGPSSVYQGQLGASVHVELANLGADSVRLDNARAGRDPPRSRGRDRRLRDVARSLVAGLDRGGGHGRCHALLRVLGSATTGTVTIDARAVATEAASGAVVRDESADAPLPVSVLPGGVHRYFLADAGHGASGRSRKGPPPAHAPEPVPGLEDSRLDPSHEHDGGSGRRRPARRRAG
jgi:hypothetical protein